MLLRVYRFTRPEIKQLVRAFGLHGSNTLYCGEPGSGYHMHPLDAMCVLLARLGNVGSWTLLGDMLFFDVAKMGVVFYHMLDLMFQQSRRRLSLFSRAYLTGDGTADADSGDRLAMFVEAIRKKGHAVCMTLVWGFIDGTVFQLCMPGGSYKFQRSVYSGHKQ
jgi:hypothetical protein